MIKTTQELPTNNPQSNDWVMAKSMLELARSKPQHNLTQINFNNVTRNTKLSLLMLPAWGVFFPPYNLSRLAGVTRAAGYDTKIFDINVKAWHELKKTAPIDYWDASREWMWQGQWYHNEISKYLEPLLEKYAHTIVSDKPDIVGLCLYYCNEVPSNWIAHRIKELLPTAKIIAGGPQTFSLSKGTAQYYDHIVQGEGEQILLDLLDGIENGSPVTKRLLVAPKTRLDLDSLPFPDYSSYDLSEYKIPNGISSEFSRGCVASCVFCNEVHFWKYRGRMSGTVLDEIEFQYKTYGIDAVWFIDSLVNGNLKELRAFVLGIVERNIKIKWQGYARCDGRMDLDYFKDLSAGGCRMLHLGIESGSQLVLNDMRKGINVTEIETNLFNSNQVGITTSTNWIIGFPTEQKQDFSDTMTLIVRTSNYLTHISPGITMMLSPGSTITTMEKEFNISPMDFQGAWASYGLENTKLHRMIRQKSFIIFLQYISKFKKQLFGFERLQLRTLYNINADATNLTTDIEYEQFDYSIIKPNINIFADSIVNEIWPLLRILWRMIGAYSIEVVFNPTVDMPEWGDRLVCNYTANHKFNINSMGKWSANFSYQFIQEPESYDGSQWDDYSFTYDWEDNGIWQF